MLYKRFPSVAAYPLSPFSNHNFPITQTSPWRRTTTVSTLQVRSLYLFYLFYNIYLFYLAGEVAAEVVTSNETDLLTSTFEVSVTLADQQLDPDSPLFSAKTFEELGLYV